MSPLTELAIPGLAIRGLVEVELGCGLMPPHPVTLTGSPTLITLATALIWTLMESSFNMRAEIVKTSSARKVFLDPYIFFTDALMLYHSLFKNNCISSALFYNI